MVSRIGQLSFEGTGRLLFLDEILMGVKMFAVDLNIAVVKLPA